MLPAIWMEVGKHQLHGRVLELCPDPGFVEQTRTTCPTSASQPGRADIMLSVPSTCTRAGSDFHKDTLLLAKEKEFPAHLWRTLSADLIPCVPPSSFIDLKRVGLHSPESVVWAVGKEERRNRGNGEIEIDIQAKLRYSKLQLTTTVSEFHIPPSYCSSHYKLFQLPEISLNLNFSTSPGAFK